MALFSADILRDCNNAPIAGIKQKIVLINSVDLPSSGLTFDTTLKNELITKIQLNTGKKGFFVEGFKQLINWNNTYNSPDEGENGFVHSLQGLRMSDPSPEARKQINEMKCGTNVYAVVQRNWAGKDGKAAYLFFGRFFGLELTELTDSSNENDGAIVFSLGTPSGFQEPYIPAIVLNTDNPTTATNFNNKFAA